MSIARESVADNPDGVVTVQSRKLHNVIHGDGAPRTVRDVEWSQEPERLVAGSLDTTAHVARLDIIAYVRCEAWPREIAPDEGKGALLT